LCFRCFCKYLNVYGHFMATNSRNKKILSNKKNP